MIDEVIKKLIGFALIWLLIPVSLLIIIFIIKKIKAKKIAKDYIHFNGVPFEPAGNAFQANDKASRLGANGETNIAFRLLQLQKRGYYGRILRNVYLPKYNDQTTEIDLLFVTRKGIFVIESKNYSGWIFGRENDEKWTATYKNGSKHNFYNPIKQNNSHIKWLKNYLGDMPCISVIVFSNKCEFKEITASCEEYHLVYEQNINQTICDIFSRYPDFITEEEVTAIADKLQNNCSANAEVKQKHIDDINSTCPRCGGKLTIRTAKKGKNVGKQFLGCSNYPHCGYTRNVN